MVRSGSQTDFAVESPSAVVAMVEDQNYCFVVESEGLTEVWQVVAALWSLVD